MVVDATARLSDFAADEVDCVVRYGAGVYPGLVAERLLPEAVLPVCSPDFAAAHRLERGPAVLGSVPLLHEDGPERDASCPDWGGWLRSHGLSSRLARDGVRLSQSSLVLEAAVAGMGLGLGKLRLAEADLAAGRLVSLFGAPWPVGFSYHFLAPAEKLQRPAIARFRAWLQAEPRRHEEQLTWMPAGARTAAE